MSFKVDGVSSIFKMCNGINSQCLIFHCLQTSVTKEERQTHKRDAYFENMKRNFNSDPKEAKF